MPSMQSSVGTVSTQLLSTFIYIIFLANFQTTCVIDRNSKINLNIRFEIKPLIFVDKKIAGKLNFLPANGLHTKKAVVEG